MTTFKKTQKAQSYQWRSVGEGSSQAAKWEVVVNGETVGTISREQGGGYMEKSCWVLRSMAQPSFVLASGTCANCKAKAKTHNWNEVLVAYVPRKK